MEEENDKIIINLSNDTEKIHFSVKKQSIDILTNVNEYILIDKKLAFDHDKIIASTLMELHNKVENTDIIFHLMPSLFTIGELKQVYELLLGKKSNKIKVTNKAIKTGGHRPSFLCKYNSNN